MTWNHRVILRKGTNGAQDYYAIHEVFYNKDGKPYLVTEEGVDVGGANLEELEETLEWMTKALSQPVIDMTYFDDLKFRK